MLQPTRTNCRSKLASFRYLKYYSYLAFKFKAVLSKQSRPTRNPNNPTDSSTYRTLRSKARRSKGAVPPSETLPYRFSAVADSLPMRIACVALKRGEVVLKRL
jgi:hypothetical protein